MIELSPNLYGVIVPEESFDFFIGKGKIGHNLEYETKDDYHFLPIPEDIYEILGTASEKEITFDCAPFVKSLTHHVDYRKKVYKDYCFEKQNYTSYFFDSPNKSFLSLAKSKGIELKPNEKLLVIKKV